jgi:hypothetical protein
VFVFCIIVVPQLPGTNPFVGGGGGGDDNNNTNNNNKIV